MDTLTLGQLKREVAALNGHDFDQTNVSELMIDLVRGVVALTDTSELDDQITDLTQERDAFEKDLNLAEDHEWDLKRDLADALKTVEKLESEVLDLNDQLVRLQEPRD